MQCASPASDLIYRVIILQKLGGSLRSLLETNKLNTRAKMHDMFEQVLMLIIAFQSCGYEHRDLHVANVLYNVDPSSESGYRFFLADFGSSRKEAKQSSFERDFKQVMSSIKYTLEAPYRDKPGGNPHQKLIEVIQNGEKMVSALQKHNRCPSDYQLSQPYPASPSPLPAATSPVMLPPPPVAPPPPGSQIIFVSSGS